MEEKRNFTLLTDFYELTMMQGYFREKADDIVVFDAFYRKNPSGSGYAIACGLEQVIDYIKNLSFSYEDVDYLRSLNMFDEEFLRMWDLYLSACAATFHNGIIDLHQILMTKGINNDLPMTRWY